MTNYAEVAVNSPAGRATFSYSVPPSLGVEVGQVVWVPFGSRVVQGIVVETGKQPISEATREIADAVTSFPPLSSLQIDLAKWISQHYFSSLYAALSLMLPPGLERKATVYFHVTDSGVDAGLLPQEYKKAFCLIKEEGKISLENLGKKIGQSAARRAASWLLQQHLIEKGWEAKGTGMGPKKVPYIKLAVGREKVCEEVERLQKARGRKQAEVLKFLLEHGLVSATYLKKELPCSDSVIKALERKGLVAREEVLVRRDPLADIETVPALPPRLTRSQQIAWESISRVIEQKEKSMTVPEVFLLFGITGSGKTEIYLRALAETVAAGKKGICLIPEISLTRQTVERFLSRFPGRVAVLHSGLTAGERFDEWWRIQKGECDVVIGPRSALFAPQENVGLIILDEEHEWTYKQEDKAPRYHAREVALKLAELGGACVILGSATPDVESFYRARTGKYRLLEMEERITPRGISSLPRVEVVDFREELKAGVRGIFSRSLIEAIGSVLEKGEQGILFLNRRGSATFIQCRQCSFVFRCPHCSVALTYHSVERKLICHRCRYAVPVPHFCPRCMSRQFRFFGVGTQKVVDEVEKLFPGARVLRWDRDVVTRRDTHDKLLERFRRHQADILVGTQMIAKGLEFPRVTLAGVVSADTGLNFPGFRAGERVFQLLCQVAGRAGRGMEEGRVIIQTYTPENYAIRAAAEYDYAGFYEQEIKYRRQCDYPPFSRFVRLIYAHASSEKCSMEAERIGQLIVEEIARSGMGDIKMIGPVPAFVSRVRDKFFWQIILRGQNPVTFISRLELHQGWFVDVDPKGVT